jgi:hypothetical protein
MSNPFTRHPHSIDESYFTHMLHSLKYSITFLWLCIMTFVHAFFPFLFTSNSSKIVRKMNCHLDNRLSSKDSK